MKLTYRKKNKEYKIRGSSRICNVEKHNYYIIIVGRVFQSIWRLTTGWTVRDRIPVGTRFSARPDRSWGPPSVFPGGKVRLGCAADHSPPSSAAVMEA